VSRADSPSAPARWLLLLVAALIVGCTEQQARIEPLQIDAGYQLRFNDSLVGHALFVLAIDATGGYRLEAFTTPAGKITGQAGQSGQEILEVSVGTLDAERIRPRRFEHSVLLDVGLKRVAFEFDWDAKTQHVSNDEVQQTLALLPGTHDRLSYLLAAGRLAQSESGQLHEIRLASLEATEQVVLQVIGRREVTVPLDTFGATGIRRVSVDGSEEREMWYAADTGPLPLRVLRRSDGNTIEMQLESLTRRGGQPVSE
jgi:hypothetical protein